ncbi:hypothetical protein AXG93_4874s1110 [Marchantia polymorpha subsp. ruderalis]|uniref:SKP1 component dimerisation domain-containing protein n=2 Tax=Embryophyta TaxID=3193 RepID=A0A176WES8_MARPO|nr:hypothetical protein AXG93_4874s1110 [Marchantia polymorpha subsp. ruderalis]
MHAPPPPPPFMEGMVPFRKEERGTKSGESGKEKRSTFQGRGHGSGRHEAARVRSGGRHGGGRDDRSGASRVLREPACAALRYYPSGQSCSLFSYPSVSPHLRVLLFIVFDLTARSSISIGGSFGVEFSLKSRVWGARACVAVLCGEGGVLISDIVFSSRKPAWRFRGCRPVLLCLPAACVSGGGGSVGAKMSRENKVKLKSSDDEMFEVDETVAYESQTVKNMIEDTGTDNPIPLPNVSSKILAKVIEYCRYHVESQKISDEKPAVPEDEIKQWDAEFVKVDQATLFDLILAANYLNIKNLLDLTCQTVADMIKGKTPEEIRKTFNIKNDFTPEEEEEVRRENQWAFE